MKDWKLIAEKDGWQFQDVDATNIYVRDLNGFEFKFSKRCFPRKRVSPMSCLTPDDYFKFQMLSHPQVETLDFSKSTFEKRFKLIEVVCTKEEHGPFKVTPGNLYSGRGCPKCAYEYKGSLRKGNTEDFIADSKLIHGDRYDYSNTNYQYSLEKVEISCNVHGVFRQAPSKHLSGQGCPDCNWLLKGFSRTKFQTASEKLGRVAQLYLINCFNESESFYKVGITTHSIKERYRKTGSMPYEYDVVDVYQGVGSDVFNCEKELFRRGHDDKYVPILYFQGNTECFSINLNKQLVTDTATEYNLEKYYTD